MIDLNWLSIIYGRVPGGSHVRVVGEETLIRKC